VNQLRPKEGFLHFTISWLVIFLAVWQLYFLFPSLDFDHTGELLLIVLLVVLAEGLAVTFPHGQLSGSFALVLATFLIYGLAETAWVSGLATFIGQGIANRGNPLRTTMFNTGQYVLATVAAGLAFQLCGGAPGLVSLPNALPIAVFIVIYIFVNHLLVYLYLMPRRRHQTQLVWLDAVKWDGLTYIFTIPLGLLIGLIYPFVSITGALLLFISVLGLQLILRLNVRLKVTNQELTAFYEMARSLNENPGPLKIMEQILLNARKALTYHSAVVYLRSDERDTFLPAATAGLYSKHLEDTVVYTGEGVVGLVLDTREPLIIDDIREEPGFGNDDVLGLYMRSLMILPLCAGGEILGAVVLGDKSSKAFDEAHLHIMTVLCSQAEIAMENALLHERLRRMSYLDSLTGLLNFSRFNQMAAELCQRASEENHPLGLILVDIDRFKFYNKRYGREAGEMLLFELAGMVEAGTRKGDLVARYGGDEFILLLPGVEGSRLREMAENLRDRVHGHTFRRPNGMGSRITVSIGFTEFPRDAGDWAGLLLAGQRALDRAKEAGGDRAVGAVVGVVK